ncbi:type-F conjugative transfer system protein TrbI [Legionella quinlivanii]|uniref:Type-F conjugative transfer system protein TrbI n=1 Tax=Legionella quinlivanii TaxID=45073 RepID=A0A364LG88_9GAMM|nr:TrbI F-type domain-containing protein [Legionella quinlivanii]RAP34894.1 type-F conjugative transfer system protein TrbI [Legionella quinlivanii]
MRVSPLFLTSIAAVLGIAGISYGMMLKTEIAFFDVEAVQGQFIRQLAEVKASESQVEQSTKRFNAVLNQLLAELALQKKIIILRKNGVLAGGMDITDEVRIKLSQAMRNPS